MVKKKLKFARKRTHCHILRRVRYAMVWEWGGVRIRGGGEGKMKRKEKEKENGQ